AINSASASGGDSSVTVFASVITGGIDATKTNGSATEISITATNVVCIDYKYRMEEKVDIAVKSAQERRMKLYGAYEVLLKIGLEEEEKKK
ncbi:unnamed protein product, partial [marine sediment metagenome]